MTTVTFNLTAATAAVTTRARQTTDERERSALALWVAVLDVARDDPAGPFHAFHYLTTHAAHTAANATTPARATAARFVLDVLTHSTTTTTTTEDHQS